MSLRFKNIIIFNCGSNLDNDAIFQGWPDFFSQGPFSVILNALGAASSHLISTCPSREYFFLIGLHFILDCG
jgi:hypothetical protein